MMRHTHHIRVYFEDTDAGGVMYHAAYLGFAERARTEALRDAALPHAMMVAEHGVMFMVRRIELEYFRPARLDDLLAIRTDTLAVTGATVTLRQAFFRPLAENLRGSAGSDQATELAVARVVLACVHTETGKAARMPARWRAALAA
jgi:acyl-CoA thioester hydrolase